MPKYLPISAPLQSARLPLLGVLALMSLLASCSGPAAIVDFHVDPLTGSNANPGTVAAPYQTLTHALTLAKAGHTIHLAAGTYDSVSGEEWPTQTGFPPMAIPNVPTGVTITADGNVVRLADVGGATTTAALVFAGEATVNGLAIAGFQRGVLAGPGTNVVLDGVQVSGSVDEGVLAYGDAVLTITGSALYLNGDAGLAVLDEADGTLEDSQFYENSPGVTVAGTANLTILGSDIHDNGTLIPGGEHSGVNVLDEAQVSVWDTIIRDNAYAGVHLQSSADVTLGTGTDLYQNFIGVVADAFLGGAARLDLNGATVRNSASEGIFWAVSMGTSFTMRDTAVVDNGGNGLEFYGSADVIDLGTSADPGGNDYSGNGNPLILDNRPNRVVANGTVITVSYDDIMPAGCLVMAGPTVGPASLVCLGETVIEIVNLNNRVEVFQ